MGIFGRMALGAAIAIGVAGAPGTAFTQQYPDRPIRLIAPYEPGGGVDIMARLVAQKFAEAIGQSVTVENRPGAGGVVGTQAVATSVPDGYTLVLASTSPIVVAPYLVKNMNYDPQKDLAPISLVANVPALLVVQPGSPIHTIPELISMAKAQPGKLTISSSGIGGTAHLSALLLRTMAGADLLHVPYKGTGPATTAVLSGEVNMSFTDVVAGLKFIRSGQLRAVAVTGAARLPNLPAVPTIAETLPGYLSGVWYAVFAPGKTPPAIVAAIDKAMVKAVRSPEMVQKLSMDGVAPIGSTPDELAKFVREESERWGKVIRASGLKPE